MDSKTARAILSEVAAGGWLDRELPEDEKDLVELAEYFVGEARLAAEEDGMGNDEHILAIINLAQASPPVLSAPVGPDSPEGPPGEIDSVTKTPITQEYEDKVTKEALVRETYPRRSSGGYSESDLREVHELPIPPATEEVTYDMPVDLTDVGDKAVRRLYIAFGGYLNRTRWLLALAESSLANATHLRDDEYRKAYLYEYREAKSVGEKPTQNVLELMAKESPNYIEWNEKVQQHAQEVSKLKALKDIYGGNVERLSREWTMRTEQYERER